MHTICFIAISRDFFEIDLPKPLLSVVVEALVFLLDGESGTYAGFLGS